MARRPASARRLAQAEMANAIDEVFPLVVGLRQRKPVASLPRRLDPLFRELAKPRPARDPDEIEELIWAIWIGHEDQRAAADMAAAVEAMAKGAFDLADAVFDRLIADYPEWAEAWNKRAILDFIARRDAQCVANIGATLRIEPRHFGAVAGFGQICLRQNRPREARAAFQVALAINPHLQGLSQIIDEIELGESPVH